MGNRLFPDCDAKVGIIFELTSVCHYFFQKKFPAARLDSGIRTINAIIFKRLNLPSEYYRANSLFASKKQLGTTGYLFNKCSTSCRASLSTLIR